MIKLSQPQRAALASGVGTTIEWYDFFIYGTAAGLVFNELFFPQFDSLAGTLLAFSTFSMAFIARPIGGLVFGHFGDRVGRKSMLIITLTFMGVTTLGIGLIPTYETIGIAAPIILVALRFVQGLSLGGELGGAILLTVEHAPVNKRGYYGSWVQLGVPMGLILGNIVFLLMVGVLSNDAFLSWGWRVPFLLGGVFVMIGMFIRLKVSESPNFDQLKNHEKVEKIPIAVVLRHYLKQVLLVFGSYFAIGVTFYATTVFGLSYGVQNTGYSRIEMLSVVIIAMATVMVTDPLFGKLSDKLGRKPVFLGGCSAMLLLAFPWLWLVNSGSIILAGIGFVLLTSAYSASAAVLPAFYAETFDPKIRYTGLSFAYTIGTVATGAITPVLATFLLGSTGSYVAIGVFLVVMCTVSVACAAAMKETYHPALNANAVATEHRGLS